MVELEVKDFANKAQWWVVGCAGGEVTFCGLPGFLQSIPFPRITL